MTQLLDQELGTTRTLLKESHSAGSVASTVRRSVLPSGLRVITESMPGVRSASVGVWIGVGSRDETPRLAGASHFLEHLLFKGTPTRTAQDISAVMDAGGGEFNAFTAREYTCFHARVLDADLPETIDVLGDLVACSLLRPADVEAERHIILDEIAMHEDDPEDVVGNLFAAAAWGNGPLGRPVAGTPESIRGLTRDQIARFYRRHYRPENVVVSVAGALDHRAVVRRVGTAFEVLDGRASGPVSRRPSAPYHSAKARTLQERRPFEQVSAVLGMSGPSRGDERRFVLGALSAVLGGGSSSRLFQEVREVRGLAYSIYSYPVHNSDSGAFCVGVACLPDRLDQVLDVTREQMALLARDGVTDDELERAKSQMRGGLILGLEDTGARMARIAKADLLLGELQSVEAMLAGIEAVTRDDVVALAQELFGRHEILAVVGPKR